MKVKIPTIVNEKLGFIELEVPEQDVVGDFCIHPYHVQKFGEIHATENLAVTHIGTGLLAGIFRPEDRLAAMELCRDLSGLHDWSKYTHYQQKDDIPSSIMSKLTQKSLRACGDMIKAAGYGN